jgi:hypothetical protein
VIDSLTLQYMMSGVIIRGVVIVIDVIVDVVGEEKERRDT